MKDPKFLSSVQDTVWANPKWKENMDAGVDKTHCAEGSLAVANGVGCHEFDPPAGGEPYMADQLFNFFQRATSNFLEKDLTDVQGLANAGSLVFAIAPSWLLLEKHGHIVSVTPGSQVKSEMLNRLVPVCLNISTKVLSGRVIGLNYAFPMHSMFQRGSAVRYFAWKESL